MTSDSSPIDDYIAAAAEQARPTLAELAAILREAAPGATEAAGLDATPQTIRFRYGEPVPRELVARIAADREEDVRLRDARWMG